MSEIIVFNLADKINLKRRHKYFALSNLSIWYKRKNKELYWNNKLKFSGPTWNEEIELPGGSYSLSDIQVYSSLSMSSKNMKHLLGCHQSKFILAIFKKEFHSKLNKDTTRNYETTWKATQKKITIDTNCVSILQWEITEAVLVHFNFVNSTYEHDSKAFHTFISNK